MLPARHRLRRQSEFSLAVRRGRRAAGSTVVAHLLRPERAATSPARVGFVVTKAVGGAVLRNRVRRRLRHSMQERVAGLPGGSLLVLRALPTAGECGAADLAADLDRTLERVSA